MKIAANYCIYNEENFISYSLASIYSFVDKIIILVANKPWRGLVGSADNTLKIVQAFPDPERKIICKTGSWRNQSEERNHALEIDKNLGMDYYWVIDADEIYEDATADKLKKALSDYPNVVNFYCGWWTYWRSFYYRIEPPETSTFVIGRIIPSFKFIVARQPAAGKTTRIDCFFHHYSYARPLERIKQKMTNITGPGIPVRSDWFDKFANWPKHKEIQDLHPFWKDHWKKAVKITRPVPEVLETHPWYSQEIIE